MGLANWVLAYGHIVVGVNGFGNSNSGIWAHCGMSTC